MGYIRSILDYNPIPHFPVLLVLNLFFLRYSGTVSPSLMPLMKGVVRLTGMTVLRTLGNSRYLRLMIILMVYLEAVMLPIHCSTDKPISLPKCIYL